MRLLIIFTFLVFSKISLACTCEFIGKISKEAVANVDAVFIGTIKSIVLDNENYTMTATFEISKDLKRSLEKSELKIKTNIDGGSCGLNFKVGQKWYVFAYLSESQLFAGLCGRSVPLSKISAKSKRLFIGRKHYRKMKKRVRQDKCFIKKQIASKKN